MSAPLALGVAFALVVLSAFFVAVEFALVTARRYRLADAARTSIAARAALRGTRELSLVLAGAQLGITLCTLGLGAVAKPAVHDLLLPVFASWGLPQTSADATAFLVALALVTFLHLVIGEMAPKSLAIAHPETSAIMLALPMRAFIRLTRPLLAGVNGLANAVLRLIGVTPVDEVAVGHNPATLRELVHHSAAAGTLDREHHDHMLAAMELHTAEVRTLARPIASVDGVLATDSVARVREVARRGGHLRLLVWSGARPVGMVHVRDTLNAAPDTTADALKRPLLILPAQMPVYTALTRMRAQRSQFALVRDGRALLGLVTMHDLLSRLLVLSRRQGDRPA